MIYLDFEFNRVNEEYVNLVCCSILDSKTGITVNWWLHNDTRAKQLLRHYLISIQNETIFGYATVAESRSFLSLTLDPVKFKWIDGFIEYRCLTNHNSLLAYGEQLVDGVVKKTRKPPPKWKRTEQDKATGFKPTHSLAEATFKLTGELRDTAHKGFIRDLIISDPAEFTPEEKESIMEYCEEDVKFLPRIYTKILENYEILLKSELILDELMSEMLLRGKYSALTAKMESWGYPIDVRKARNFSNSVGPLIEDCQREINSLFPAVKPFVYNAKDRRFSMNTKNIKAWLCENVDTDLWVKTDGGKSGKKDLSLALDSWTNVFNYTHNYPTDNFGAQMVRFLKLKQNMSGFVPTVINKNGGRKRNFWDAVGSDGRVRAYFNIYGAQSSRSQPFSVSFLFLKSAWMRVLCSPAKGKAICSIDYGSEEFFISSLLGKGDKNMQDAYLSGDVYLYFAKLAGFVPWEGVRENYKKERNIFKQVVLSISYQQTALGLSKKLTEVMGEEFTEAEAQEFIAKFYEAFVDFKYHQDYTLEEYRINRKAKLPCGWWLWDDQDNFRSSNNFVSQGYGASIMRKAVEFADEMGLKVIVTLHDALYIEYDSEDFSAIDKLQRAMQLGFMHYFENKELASKIKMDIYAWSPDYKTDSEIKTPGGLTVDVSDLYIDERSIDEYEKFKGYFDDRVEDNYL
jgi:hypothetical protein